MPTQPMPPAREPQTVTSPSLEEAWKSRHSQLGHTSTKVEGASGELKP